MFGFGLAGVHEQPACYTSTYESEDEMSEWNKNVSIMLDRIENISYSDIEKIITVANKIDDARIARREFVTTCNKGENNG